MVVKSVIDYLGINKIGVVEFIIALFPIMAGYSFSPIYLSFVIPLLLICYCIAKGTKTIKNKTLLLFSVYLFFHEVILCLFVPAVGYTPFTNVIGDITHVIVILFIINTISLEKLKGSVMLIAFISSIGLLYHFLLISGGQTVTPIQIPFLPDPGASSRLHEVGVRPVSFFWEPAAYATFMLLPLFVAIYEKKYLLVGAFLFFIALSTSTSGIALSAVMVLTWVLVSGESKMSKVLIFLFAVGLVYLSTLTDLFEAGIAKMEQTHLEETARTINGPILIQNLSFNDLIWGIPDNTPTDYWLKGKVSDIRLIGDEELYLSTFWYVLVKLGVIGLIIYLSIFVSAYNKDKKLLPLISALAISLFSSNLYIGSHFVYFFIFLFAMKYKKSEVNLSRIK